MHDLLSRFFQAGYSRYGGATWGVWFFVIPCTRGILHLGRNKKAYRELMKSMSFFDKVLMRNFVELSKAEKNLQRFIVIATYIFYLSVLVLVLGIVFDRTHPAFAMYCRNFLRIKTVLVELPAFVVVRRNTYRKSKPGEPRVEDWKFKRDYRRTRKSGYNQ